MDGNKVGVVEGWEEGGQGREMGGRWARQRDVKKMGVVVDFRICLKASWLLKKGLK